MYTSPSIAVDLEIKVAFSTAGVAAALASYTECRRDDSPSADAKLLDETDEHVEPSREVLNNDKIIEVATMSLFLLNCRCKRQSLASASCFLPLSVKR